MVFGHNNIPFPLWSEPLPHHPVRSLYDIFQRTLCDHPFGTREGESIGTGTEFIVITGLADGEANLPITQRTEGANIYFATVIEVGRLDPQEILPLSIDCEGSDSI